MNRNINVKDFNIVRNAGIKALVEDLGVIGTINFIRQFDMGYGDYTKERSKLNDNKSVTDIIADIKKRRV